LEVNGKFDLINEVRIYVSPFKDTGDENILLPKISIVKAAKRRIIEIV